MAQMGPATEQDRLEMYAVLAQIRKELDKIQEAQNAEFNRIMLAATLSLADRTPKTNPIAVSEAHA